MSGQLVIVGTGIKFMSHVSVETLSHIRQADKLLYLVADSFTTQWLHDTNASAESLYRFYDPRSLRLESYLRMTDHIMSFVRRDMRVCVAFYGHAGIFVFPGHEAVIRAREEGFPAVMHPAISSEDCLFADLGIDPGRVGCQAFEANDFLIHRRSFDPSSVLILWQVGVLGQIGFGHPPALSKCLDVLRTYLARHLPMDHRCIVYEASALPVLDPKIVVVPVGNLSQDHLSAISTVVIPPSRPAKPDAEMMEALGIPGDYMEARGRMDIKYRVDSPRF